MPIPSEVSTSGLLTPSPVADTPQPVTTIEVTEKKYSDIAIDTRWTPIDSILPHVAGAAWTVDYYGQVLDTDSQLMSQAPTVSPVFQQYNLIKGLELRVTSVLNLQQDDETKMMQIDGTALIHCKLIANEGDMFIADIGVGKPAVFRVTGSKKNSIFKEATYEITYAMASTDAEYVEDLEHKVINEYVYHKDFLTRGLDPVVLEEDSVAMGEILAKRQQLADTYFSTFYNPEYKTITLPGQSTSVYDPFLVEFLSEQFGKEDSPYLQEIRTLNMGRDLAFTQGNFWDALVLRDPQYLKLGFTRVGLVYAAQFDKSPTYDSFRWTGIAQSVYPVNPRIGVGGMASAMVKTLNTNTLVSTTPYTYYADVAPPALGVDASANRMYPSENLKALADPLSIAADGTMGFASVVSDDYYVLSENFYKRTENLSVLEHTVWQYLTRQALDPVQLVKTAELVPHWGVLEQLYYAPILMVLMQAFVYDHQG